MWPTTLFRGSRIHHSPAPSQRGDETGSTPLFDAGELDGPSTLQVALQVVVGGDVVEVAPPFDPSGNTALVGATLMYEILCLLAERVSQR